MASWLAVSPHLHVWVSSRYPHTLQKHAVRLNADSNIPLHVLEGGIGLSLYPETDWKPVQLLSVFAQCVPHHDPK